MPGFIFDALASLAGVVALFLALKAYTVAKRRHWVTYQLSLLQQLNNLRNDRGFLGELKAYLAKPWSTRGRFAYTNPPTDLHGVLAPLVNLHDTLPTWFRLAYPALSLSSGGVDLTTLHGKDAAKVANALDLEVNIAVKKLLS